MCDLCSQDAEDVLHSLWSCPALTRVWEDDPQWAFWCSTGFQNFTQVLLHVLDSDYNRELFSMLVWNIWYRRNHARTTPPPPRLAFGADSAAGLPIPSGVLISSTKEVRGSNF